jgi:drug/metabolite transporter (DMT)-like permease
VACFLVASGFSMMFIGYIFASEHRFHPFMTSIGRGIVTVIMMYFLGRYLGIELTFPSSHNFKWQNIRNTILFFQNMIYSWSVYYLPLPIAITLQVTSPIFATMWDRILYGVTINTTQMAWFAVTFTGVLLTLNGNSITGDSSIIDSKYNSYFSKDPAMTFWAASILLVSVFVHGYGVVITKKLKNTDGI